MVELDVSFSRAEAGIDNVFQTHVLVVTDSFTKYSWAFPTHNQQAPTVAKLLWEKILVNFGFPQRLHSDQGRDFESRIIRDLCKVAGIEKTRTTPYHLQGNGQTERFNQTLLGMLGTLDADKKNDWPEYVLPLVHAYNCTRHSSTGYSPYFLMFGRTPRLPIDVSLGVAFDNGGTQPYTVYAENLRTRLHHAHDLAAQNARKKAAKSNKKRYDVQASPGVLLPGDCVLVRNLSSRGKSKLKERWEDTPYLVLGRVGDLPVYVVQQEGTGKKRTLHRNLLLPYHVPHETSPATVATRTDPGPRNQSLGHPDTTHPADVNYDEGHEELEPIAVVTTEDSILNSDASPFVPAAVEDQPLEDPPPDDVLPTGPESAGTTDDAEPVGPVAAVTTRSERAIHPPDCLISNSVWAQVRSVLRAWLGD